MQTLVKLAELLAEYTILARLPFHSRLHRCEAPMAIDTDHVIASRPVMARRESRHKLEDLSFVLCWLVVVIVRAIAMVRTCAFEMVDVAKFHPAHAIHLVLLVWTSRWVDTLAEAIAWNDTGFEEGS
jgi:hypothetical protein